MMTTHDDTPPGNAPGDNRAPPPGAEIAHPADSRDGARDDPRPLDQGSSSVNSRLREKVDELERRVQERTAELARREAELKTLADNVPSMYSYIDAGEVYRYVNRIYERHWKRRADQIIGKSVREVLGPEGYAIAKPYIDAALAGEPQRYEHEFEFAETRYVMDVFYAPDKAADGRIRGVYVLVNDISERKALERRLYGSEQHLRAIVDTAADGIITVNKEGIIRDFNRAAERMFGLPAAAAVGRNARVVLPPHCGGCVEFPACFRTGRCVRTAGGLQELTGYRHDGTTFPMEITVSEIDHLNLHVILARDISVRKHLEKEIIDISSLEQERIGRDIHDGVGQQLTGLTMLAHSLEKRLAASGHADESAEAGKLVAHLQETLAQTRSLARGLAPVEIDPAGLADALARLTEDVMEMSGVTCRFSVGDGVQVNDKNVALHLYRIAQEAMSNAVRHGKPRHIDVSLSDHAGLKLAVRDDGVGLPDNGKPRRSLGLHIMRYRAGIVGGQFNVVPAEGGGTLVTCVIPEPRT